MESKIEKVKMYTAVDVQNKLDGIGIEVEKAQAVLRAFVEPLEDMLCKPNKTQEKYAFIGMDLERSFELLSVVHDYLYIIEQSLNMDSEV